MGNRLSKIYTRTGDDGTTGLGDGTRVRKDDARIEAIGAVDEANSAIGLVLGLVLSETRLPVAIIDQLSVVQHELFDLGGELSIPGHRIIEPEFITRLEDAIETFNADLPSLKEFILPGGGRAAAACHLARALVRRAERRAWALVREEPIREELPRYLNRLSDLLFVIARVLARHETGAEVLWRRDRAP